MATKTFSIDKDNFEVLSLLKKDMQFYQRTMTGLELQFNIVVNRITTNLGLKPDDRVERSFDLDLVKGKIVVTETPKIIKPDDKIVVAK